MGIGSRGREGRRGGGTKEDVGYYENTGQSLLQGTSMTSHGEFEAKAWAPWQGTQGRTGVCDHPNGAHLDSERGGGGRDGRSLRLLPLFVLTGALLRGA